MAKGLLIATHERLNDVIFPPAHFTSYELSENNKYDGK